MLSNPDLCQVVRGREDCGTLRKICLWRKIKLSPLRRVRRGKKTWLTFLFFFSSYPPRQFKPLASSIALLHLSLTGFSSLCQSQDSRIQRGIKTAYHDDKGDGSYKTPYEVVVHA